MDQAVAPGKEGSKTMSGGDFGSWAMLQDPGTTIAAEACPIRDVLNRLGDAWSFLVVLRLADGPRRFNELKRRVGGVSQRMLTVTLRSLERDGLVSRKVFPTTPPPGRILPDRARHIACRPDGRAHALGSREPCRHQALAVRV